MRFKTKIKDCYLIVKVRTGFGETINERELDIFSRKYLRGFFKPKAIKKNLVEYQAPKGINLKEYLSKKITKYDFFFMIEQIIITIQKLQANNLSLKYLVLDINHVYINTVTKELQFIYLPSDSTTSNTLEEFFDSVIYSSNLIEEDSNYIADFVYFLRQIKTLDFSKIEKYIEKKDRRVIKILKKMNMGGSGYMTNNPLHYHEHYETDEKDDLKTELMDKEDNTDKIDDDPTTILMEEEATTLLVDEEATTLLIEDDVEKQSIHYPTIMRVNTEEVIVINKPVFRIGKEKSYVDYFVANNNAVSRGHANIVTRNKRFYVVDLNSKNHTYINDEILPVGEEIEILDGDTLRLGNEEFIFND